MFLNQSNYYSCENNQTSLNHLQSKNYYFFKAINYFILGMFGHIIPISILKTAKNSVIYVESKSGSPDMSESWCIHLILCLFLKYFKYFFPLFWHSLQHIQNKTNSAGVSCNRKCTKWTISLHLTWLSLKNFFLENYNFKTQFLLYIYIFFYPRYKPTIVGNHFIWYDFLHKEHQLSSPDLQYSNCNFKNILQPFPFNIYFIRQFKILAPRLLLLRY